MHITRHRGCRQEWKGDRDRQQVRAARNSSRHDGRGQGGVWLRRASGRQARGGPSSRHDREQARLGKAEGRLGRSRDGPGPGGQQSAQSAFSWSARKRRWPWATGPPGSEVCRVAPGRQGCAAPVSGAPRLQPSLIDCLPRPSPRLGKPGNAPASLRIGIGFLWTSVLV